MSENDSPLLDGRPTRVPGELPSTSEIEAWLISYLSQLLGINPAEIDTRKPFTFFGLSSAEGVILAGDLENWLGRSLPATLAWDHPNIEAVARDFGRESNLSKPVSADSSDHRSAPHEMDKFLTEIEQLSEQEVETSLERERQLNQGSDPNE